MNERKLLLLRFGENFRAARLAAGWTQEEVAERAGFDRTYISLVERGHRNPGLLTLLKLAKSCNITLEELVKGLS
jgi:transcriptional regulator with XRE-family HTH domain